MKEVLDAAVALGATVIARIFARYGKPLDDESLKTPLDPAVLLADGTTRLGHLRFRAQVDVIANDYFVLASPGADPVAIPGPLFAAIVARFSAR